jgi:hypothetical protein
VHTEVKVCYAAFRRLRPFFVQRLRDFNSCCCKHHQEMAEITVGFNNMRSNKVHLIEGEEFCDCWCLRLCCKSSDGQPLLGPVTCQHLQHTYKRSTHLWGKTLCSKPDRSEWHSLQCLKGKCMLCGFNNLPICDRELDPENQRQMTWQRFEKVPAGKMKDGKHKFALRLEYKLTSLRVFLAYAKPRIAEFVLHQHVARWQDRAYRTSITKLKVGEVMSLIDFAENYSYKGQNEVQSQHWYNFQLSILVHITYTVNPFYDAREKDSKRLSITYYYYVSDDRKHYSLFVQHYLTLHWNSMVLAGTAPSRHIVWSDGCASQFKGAKTWFYVAK